jgi:hypothetical protein
MLQWQQPWSIDMTPSHPIPLACPPLDDRLAREWSNRLSTTMSHWFTDLLTLRHQGGLEHTWLEDTALDGSDEVGVVGGTDTAARPRHESRRRAA